MKVGKGVALLTFALLAPAALGQQDRIHYSIPAVGAAPAIDGEFSPGEWANALMVPLDNETHPTQNVPALVDTEVYLMEDGDKFYLAFVAHDPTPDKIRAFYRDRDASWNDDFVGVVIDTFNDQRRGFEFFSNALGVQMDAIMDDVVGNEDASWNAIWDSAGRINEGGYVVEMAIPLAQLRFAEGVEKQIWGIDLLRFYPRDVRHRLSNNLSDYSLSCYICQLKKAEGFENLEAGVNLQLIPTLTASMAEYRPDPAADSWTRDDAEAEGSLDVRWGISRGLFLNATLNPDFSQVETDNAQLDINNTFSLFFPERREFFLDGADYFNTRVNLVHTRNIAEPHYGLKLTGKHENHTYGLFAADDQSTSFLIPGTQSSRAASLGGPDSDVDSRNAVLRYRYDLGSSNSTVGLLATSRNARNYHNHMLGLDGNLRFSDSDRVEVQWMRSTSRYPAGIQEDFDQPASLSDDAYDLRYRHQDDHWSWNLRMRDYGEDFRADMGFITQVDYKQHNGNIGHTWRFGPDSFFNTVNVNGGWFRSWDQDGLELVEGWESGLNLNGPMQSYAFVGLNQRQRYWDGRYYDEHNVILYGNVRPAGGIFLGMEIVAGDTIDFANSQLGEVLTLRPEISLQLGRHLQLNLQHNHQKLDVDGGRLYTTDLSDIRVTWQFDVRSFVRLIVQYSDTEREPLLYDDEIDRRSRSLNTQLLYSYKLNAQTRFFVGYSDSGFQNDLLDRIEQTNRTLFAKFSYAWQY